MRRRLLSALLCLFATPALAAGNFEFDIPAPPGLELTIAGYAADGSQTFSVTTSDVRERDGKSIYVTRVDEQVIFASRPARLCVSDPSGTWDALPEGKTEVCDEHPSEVRGTYTFVPTTEQAAGDVPAPLATTLGCASDLLAAAGYLELGPHIGADEAVRRAAIRFSAVQVRDPKLPRLETGTLKAWCKRFAGLPKSSITPLPALLARLNFGPDVSISVARDTASGVLEAAAYIETATGYRLDTAPAIFISADPDWMTDVFVAETNLPPSQWPERRAQFAACNGGEANFRMLFMCTSSKVFSENWFGAGHKAQRAYALAHELFHVVQNELVGRQPDGCCDEQQFLGRLGPVWLIEGSAEYVAFRLLADSGRLKLAREMKNQANNARKASGSAADFELRSDYFSDSMAPSVGMVATENLLGGIGLSALPRYWAQLGHGSTWQAAFEQSFGLPPSAFYGAHDQRVAKPVAAGEMVECVQAGLGRLGFSEGGVDGVLGPGTKRAFAAYASKYVDQTEENLSLDTAAEAGTVCLYMARNAQLDAAATAIADRIGLQATFALTLDVEPDAVASVSITDFGNNPLVKTDILPLVSGADDRPRKQLSVPFVAVRDAANWCLSVNDGWLIKGADGTTATTKCDWVDPVIGTNGLSKGFTLERATH